MLSVTIRSGTRLGPYEILAPIGSGGMGEVYRGRDTRLGRTVAIKILPAQFQDDAKFRTRFEREAKAISSLNHPHICALYDVGPHYLVMEHCEGKTLAELIGRLPLPLDRVVQYAIEIADALDKAHRQGIVHRDLKPGNIIVTKDGTKLLDFGLAKHHLESSTEGSATLEKSLTAEGNIVGTIQYMSPEVLQGHEADSRSDIFAFGLVLYEMVTGRRAFVAGSRASLTAAILEHEPESLPEAVPPALASVIRACLQKDPDERIQTAHDAKLQLRSLQQNGMAALALPSSRRRLWIVYAAAAMAAGGLLTSFALLQLLRQETPPLRATFTRLTDVAGVEAAPAISPDGKLVAYDSFAAGNADVYLRRIGGQRSVNLTFESKTDDRTPAFSPDGQLIAFRSERDGGGIFVMGATGESVRRVSDFGFNPAWSPDGKELAVSSQPVWGDPYTIAPIGELWRIEVTTGRKRRVFQGDAVSPSWSPRGEQIAFCRSRQGNILTIRSTGGEPTEVTHGESMDWNPVWSGDGQHIYFSSNRGGSINVWRIAVNEVTGKALSEPEPLTTPALWSGPLGISADGKRIVYCARDRQSNLQRISFDPARETVVGPVVEITHGKTFISSPDLSPDGEWITFSSRFQQEDVHVVRSDGSDLRRLTDDPFSNGEPRWSPDGKRIAFSSKRVGVTPKPATPYQIWAINADGSELKQLTADINGAGAGVPVWSPDGRRLAVKSTRGCKSGACLVDLTGALPAKVAEPLPLFQEGYQIAVVGWSPDGKWLLGMAWRRDKVTDGQGFVYSVDTREYRPLPRPLKERMSACWMSDSRRILQLHDNTLYLLDRSTGKARAIHSFDFNASSLVLSKDNRTIYVLRTSDEADIWLAELQ